MMVHLEYDKDRQGSYHMVFQCLMRESSENIVDRRYELGWVLAKKLGEGICINHH